MENYFRPAMTEREINAMSALALAHIGDAVFELLVRSSLCISGGTTNGNLHHRTVALVCAEAQAARADRLLPLLTFKLRPFNGIILAHFVISFEF